MKDSPGYSNTNGTKQREPTRESSQSTVSSGTSNEPKESKPFGFYTEKPDWTKDKEVAYFSGFELQVFWPVLKISILAVIMTTLSLLGVSVYIGILTCVMITMFYQDVVCLILPNTHKVGPMDQ